MRAVMKPMVVARAVFVIFVPSAEAKTCVA